MMINNLANCRKRILLCFFSTMLFMPFHGQNVVGEAQYKEGERFWEAKDTANAIYSFKAAAELGYTDAMYELIEIYKDEKKDYAEAVLWSRHYIDKLEEKYSEQPISSKEDTLDLWIAYYNLAELYKEGGHGIKRNLSLAVTFYEKASIYNSSSANDIFVIADSYLSGDEEENIEEDKKQALILYKKAYNCGSKYAAYEIGDCYRNGWGTAKNEKKAFEWYNIAAEGEEHIRALNMLGVCYYDGIGTEKNIEKAVYYMTKAAEKNDPASQRNLAFYFLDQAKDDQKAFYWIKKAAENGFIEAQKELGWFYEKGIGTETDDIMAAKWYQKAADRGNAGGQNNLAMMYYYGKGVERDFRTSFLLLQKAAEGGNASAQYNLGFFYEEGIGTRKNEEKSIFWYLKAAEQGHIEAKNKFADGAFP